MPDKALLAAAEKLAERMAHHADCEEHPKSQASPQCPYCLDRAAYSTWLASGGRDYQRRPSGPSVSLANVIVRTTGEGLDA
jgi:hypothetical protein